jgi:H+/Cl- antiporter ClcA
MLQKPYRSIEGIERKDNWRCNMGKTKLYKILSDMNTLKWSLAGKGILAGLSAGFLVVLYRLGIDFGTEKSMEAYAFMKHHPLYVGPWICLVLAVGFLIYLLVKWEPFAKGSGIPQVEGIVLYGMKMKWFSVLLVRFIAGIFASFFGVSLGREGPSIQIGAAGSQALAKKISRNKLEENYLITAGASAGLSAAFSAPLSGIMFSLEEIHRSFSPNMLIAATTAALTADVVSKYVFGLKTVLSFAEITQLQISCYLWLPVIGVVSGSIGAGVNKALLGMSTVYGKLPSIMRPIVALLIALPFGLLIPEVLGGGQNLIQISEEAETGLAMMFVLLLVKVLFTCTSFGSGIPGGIFMPILAIGAVSGNITGLAAVQVGLPPEYIPVFCICSMAGVLSGAVKAPITSILLMAEMTGSLVHLLPVASVAFIALLTSDMLKTAPIYEVLLERITYENKKQVKNNKTCAIIEMSVELGSKADGKRISEVKWPNGALIVGLRRGEKEYVPNGNMEVNHGDYLVVLSSQQQFEEMNRELMEVCRC